MTISIVISRFYGAEYCNKNTNDQRLSVNQGAKSIYNPPSTIGSLRGEVDILPQWSKPNPRIYWESIKVLLIPAETWYTSVKTFPVFIKNNTENENNDTCHWYLLY